MEEAAPVAAVEAALWEERENEKGGWSAASEGKDGEQGAKRGRGTNAAAEETAAVPEETALAALETAVAERQEERREMGGKISSGDRRRRSGRRKANVPEVAAVLEVVPAAAPVVVVPAAAPVVVVPAAAAEVAAPEVAAAAVEAAAPDLREARSNSRKSATKRRHGPPATLTKTHTDDPTHEVSVPARMVVCAE